MADVKIAAATRALQPPYCGDQARWWKNSDTFLVCLVDGLGHGQKASQAAELALEFVGRNRRQSLESIFAGCDAALRPSRGTVMAVVRAGAGQLSHAAVGNIGGAVVAGRTIRLSGTRGIVGAGYRKLRINTTTFGAGDMLIMWTDGVGRNIDFAGYLSASGTNVQTIATDILDRFARDSDDAAVVVLRNTASE